MFMWLASVGVPDSPRPGSYTTLFWTQLPVSDEGFYAVQQSEHSLEGRLAWGLCASLIGRSASIALLDKSCAEERDCLLACVLSAETQLQLKTAAVQSMGEITFKVRQGQEDLTVVHYDSPLSVAQAKQALLEENTSWIGALQEEGSSRRVGGDQRLKPGSSYILTLQCQAGECYLLLLLFWLMGLKNAASQPLLCLEEIAIGFSAYPACLHIHLAYEKSQCSLSASSVAGVVAIDLTAYFEGIGTQQ